MFGCQFASDDNYLVNTFNICSVLELQSKFHNLRDKKSFTMSSFSSVFLPSVSARKEKNVLWIDTYYLDLSPHTITNMSYNVVWNSEIFKPRYFDFELQFQFVKINNAELKLTCTRTPVSPPTDNYILKFHCSINIFDQDPIVLVLECDRSKIFQKYDLNSSFLCMTSNGFTAELQVKILVKMIEYECESNVGDNHQEELFREMRETFFNELSVLEDLRYILNVPVVQDIFTGRQSNEFAELKTTYITRISTFSKEIAEYMKAKEECSLLPLIDLGIILNYILNGEAEQIDDKDLLKVYFEAHCMGLNFLVDLSRDAISDRFVNKSDMIEPLLAAEHVGDNILFEKLGKKFYTYKTEPLNDESSSKLHQSGIQGLFMVRSLGRLLKKKDSKSDVEIGESSK